MDRPGTQPRAPGTTWPVMALAVSAAALSREVRSLVRHPAVIMALFFAAGDMLPALVYGRDLWALEPARAIPSLAVSGAGSAALLLLLACGASGRRVPAWLLGAGLAIAATSMELVYFGVYREFATLPTVSIADFARQNTRYARALFVERLSPSLALAAVAGVSAAAAGVRRACGARLRPSRAVLSALALATLAPATFAHAPYLSISQHALWLALQSSQGPGQINTTWTPDRARPLAAPAARPLNVLLFRLEEVAALATTLARPELATTPFLRELIDSDPGGAFVGQRHYSNATATDVSVLSLFTGLSPAAPLDAHRRAPMLWDYFSAAGYDTSFFLPDHLEWGDFRRRFAARPGELNLRRVVDAGGSRHPLVYDHSLNDTAVVDDALDYQRQRGWAEPFLTIVSLRMPHAIGEGARINGYDYGPWTHEPPELFDYYNGIRHDDGLMRDMVSAIPEPVRARTAIVVVSDHGTRLFERRDGGGRELHRLDNYHVETTRVPFLIQLPLAARERVQPPALEALRDNLTRHATSNIDLLPTLLGLVGIQPAPAALENPELLVGRDLTFAVEPTRAIVQLNTGPLRRWEREHFGVVLEDGARHYLFYMGRTELFDVASDPLEKTDRAADPALARARAIGRGVAAQLPELFRIEQRYPEAR